MNRYLHGVYAGETDPTFVPSADDAWFPISGYLNSQTSRAQSEENPTLIHETSIYDVGVWCAVDARKFTAPTSLCDHKFTPI